MKPQQIIIDTDPGIDDALTFLLACALPEEVQLAALTVVHGNCPLDQAVQNARDILAVLHASHIPVVAGCRYPLLRPPFTAPETHGLTGLGNAVLPTAPDTDKHSSSEHGVDTLIKTILAAPGEVTLVAIGPLTNIALALRKEPRIIAAVRQVIIMGGALHAEGNTTPLAEFNVYVDPHAAQIVLSSGMPIVLLPWDITKNVLLTWEDVEQLQKVPGIVPQLVADLTRPYIDFHLDYFGFAGCSINDPVALALAVHPELARLEAWYVEVECSSEVTMGKTVAYRQPPAGKQPNVQAVVAFDTNQFMAFFLERLTWLAQQVH